MSKISEKQSHLSALIEQVLNEEEEFQDSEIPHLQISRYIRDSTKNYGTLEPGICFTIQGRKDIIIDNMAEPFQIEGGHFFSGFLPMILKTRFYAEKQNAPVICLGMSYNKAKMAEMVRQINTLDPLQDRGEDEPEKSAFFTDEITPEIYTILIKMIEIMKSPLEKTILGPSLIDELYYRLLTSPQGKSIRYFISRNTRIDGLSRAVDYVYSHLDQSVTVEKMAESAGMGCSSFQKHFKSVMKQSPLKYAKAIKLNEARQLLSRGISVSEAGYRLGYSSPAHFSRDFKHFFGMPPSRTRSA